MAPDYIQRCLVHSNWVRFRQNKSQIKYSRLGLTIKILLCVQIKYNSLIYNSITLCFIELNAYLKLTLKKYLLKTFKTNYLHYFSFAILKFYVFVWFGCIFM
jgi:hypothetical protein